MTVYEKNLKCIKKNCPYIDLGNPCKDSFSMNTENSKNGFLTASAVGTKPNGKRVYLHSKYNPVKEAGGFYCGCSSRTGRRSTRTL